MMLLTLLSLSCSGNEAPAITATSTSPEGQIAEIQPRTPTVSLTPTPSVTEPITGVNSVSLAPDKTKLLLT